MIFKARENETIFDSAIERYGDVSYCVKLLLDNRTQLDDINSSISGLNLEYDETLKAEIERPLTTNKTFEKNRSLIYNARVGQSIFDISLMTDGGFEEIVTLYKNSNLVRFNSKIDQSSKFNYIEKDTALLEWVRKTGQVFVSGLESDINEVGREHNSGFSTVEFT